MAVYTRLTRGDIVGFIAPFAIGELISFDGILQGVENTNYRIVTDKGNFILTIFEKRVNETDLPFIFDFMSHLNEAGINCPRVIGTGRIGVKAAALLSFLDGHNLSAVDIDENSCYEAGQLVARMHLAAQTFHQSRANSMSLPAWRNIFARLEPHADEIEPGLARLLEEEITTAAHTLSLDLPTGVVHADLFPDNVFMRGGRISGVIDFYFSAVDFLAYDLAIALNAWVFEEGVFNRRLYTRFLDGYQSERVLTPEEKSAFQAVARMAALRILLTRSADFIFHDSADHVIPKNPLEYKRILEFHIHDNLFG